jgi:hypothetical protein
MPIIPASQEAEIRRITVPRQPRKIFCKIPSQSVIFMGWHAPVIPVSYVEAYIRILQTEFTSSKNKSLHKNN